MVNLQDQGQPDQQEEQPEQARPQRPRPPRIMMGGDPEAEQQVQQQEPQPQINGMPARRRMYRRPGPRPGGERRMYVDPYLILRPVQRAQQPPNPAQGNQAQQQNPRQQQNQRQQQNPRQHQNPRQQENPRQQQNPRQQENARQQQNPHQQQNQRQPRNRQQQPAPLVIAQPAIAPKLRRHILKNMSSGHYHGSNNKRPISNPEDQQLLLQEKERFFWSQRRMARQQRRAQRRRMAIRRAQENADDPEPNVQLANDEQAFLFGMRNAVRIGVCRCHKNRNNRAVQANQPRVRGNSEPKQNNPEQDNSEQNNPEQNNPEQNNPEQDNPEQNHLEQNHPQQNNPEQNNSEQNNPEQNNPEQNNPEQNNQEQNNQEQNAATAVQEQDAAEAQQAHGQEQVADDEERNKKTDSEGSHGRRHQSLITNNRIFRKLLRDIVNLQVTDEMQKLRWQIVLKMARYRYERRKIIEKYEWELTQAKWQRVMAYLDKKEKEADGSTIQNKNQTCENDKKGDVEVQDKSSDEEHGSEITNANKQNKQNDNEREKQAKAAEEQAQVQNVDEGEIDDVKKPKESNSSKEEKNDANHENGIKNLKKSNISKKKENDVKDEDATKKSKKSNDCKTKEIRKKGKDDRTITEKSNNSEKKENSVKDGDDIKKSKKSNDCRNEEIRKKGKDDRTVTEASNNSEEIENGVKDGDHIKKSKTPNDFREEENIVKAEGNIKTPEKLNNSKNGKNCAEDEDENHVLDEQQQQSDSAERQELVNDGERIGKINNTSEESLFGYPVRQEQINNLEEHNVIVVAGGLQEANRVEEPGVRPEGASRHAFIPPAFNIAEIIERFLRYLNARDLLSAYRANIEWSLSAINELNRREFFQILFTHDFCSNHITHHYHDPLPHDRIMDVQTMIPRVSIQFCRSDSRDISKYEHMRNAYLCRACFPVRKLMRRNGFLELINVASAHVVNENTYKPINTLLLPPFTDMKCKSTIISYDYAARYLDGEIPDSLIDPFFKSRERSCVILFENKLYDHRFHYRNVNFRQFRVQFFKKLEQRHRAGDVFWGGRLTSYMHTSEHTTPFFQGMRLTFSKDKMTCWSTHVNVYPVISSVAIQVLSNFRQYILPKLKRYSFGLQLHNRWLPDEIAMRIQQALPEIRMIHLTVDEPYYSGNQEFKENVFASSSIIEEDQQDLKHSDHNSVILVVTYN